jgi:hypothetical protein
MPWPVSMTQNFSTILAWSAIATHRSANASSMTAKRAWAMSSWCRRNSPS